MYKRVSIALKQPYVTITLRILTLIVLGCFAFWKWQDLPSGSIATPDISWSLFLSAAVLSIANLGAEAEKYRSLFGKRLLETSQAFYAVLSGMAIGIWTPNRVGEVLGRVKEAPAKYRLRAFEAGLAGSVVQGVITLVFGLVAVFLFPKSLDLLSGLIPNIPWLVMGGLLVSCILIAVGFKFKNRSGIIRSHRLAEAFAWGILRYFIFCTQFALLLYSFGFSGSLSEAFSGIALLYLLQSYVPGSFLSELGLREALSVILFAEYFDDPLFAPLAAFCLWVFNIGLPISIRIFFKSVFPISIRVE